MIKSLKLLIWSGIMLASLFSCEIDEERNLLFQLKDTLPASGFWGNGSGTDGFRFEANGTFTVTTITGISGSGSFRYSEVTSESIFTLDNQVAKFDLTWNQELVNSSPSTLYVYKRRNGDLYFTLLGTDYVQIS